MKICLEHESSVPLTFSQTSRKPEKIVAAPSNWRKKFCACADGGLRSASPKIAPNRMPNALRNAPFTC